jgi:hypothetical protein
MEPYISERYRALLTRQGLYTLAGFWNLPWDWVENPNNRRNGWSGVSRHTFFDDEAGRFSIFVKRQENHNYRSLRHPLRGRPTFFSELCNTLRVKQIGIPTVEPVFYGERWEGDKPQAVLATIALEGYGDLNSLLQDPSNTTPVRQAILHRLADVAQLMHHHRLQHNSLGGNHVLVKLEKHNTFDLRILDLEKMRRSFRPMDAAVKDLEKFIRRTPRLTKDERAEFLLYYTQNFNYGQRRQLLKRIDERLLFKCSRKGMVAPISGMSVSLPDSNWKYAPVSINRLGRIKRISTETLT